MTNRITGSFRESPVEVTSGLITLVGGLALTSQDGWPRILGAILTAVASYLISWTMAAVTAREDARIELQNRMAQVGTHLATTSSQIVEAIRAGELGESGSQTAFARVRDSAASLFGLVQQIEEQSGKAISSKAVIQNAERLMGLSSRLRQILSTAESFDTEELHEVQTELEAVAEELGEKSVPRPLVTANCPNCAKATRFPIGQRKGDSAMPTCENCGSRFHAHRQGDGEIFTRNPGSHRLVALREIEVACPACGRAIALRVAEDEEEPKVRFCFSCYTRLVIDPAESSVVRYNPAEVHETRMIGSQENKAGSRGTKAVLECSGCERPVTSFLRNDDGVFAVCHHCEPPRLLRANFSPPHGSSMYIFGSSLDMDQIIQDVDRLKKLSKEAAVNYLKECANNKPRDANIQQILGASLRKWAVEIREQGDRQRAERLLEEAVIAHDHSLELLDKDDDDLAASIYYAKRRALLELGKEEESRDSLEAALRANPDHEKARTYMEGLNGG